jgi:CxxC motif-containing protein (DUF1111 family)
MEYFNARHATRWFTGCVVATVCCYCLQTSALPSPIDPRPHLAVDPGPRGGAPGAGGTFATIDNTSTAGNQADRFFFYEARQVFQEVVSVTGSIATTVPPFVNGGGLGPTYNLNQCAGCHIQPAVGGSSPARNPQVANNFAHLNGASNPADTSKFLSDTGPIREVRFILVPGTTTPDGGVHDIFTIAGRTDAPGCNLQQPDFDTQIANHNAIFRIPLPIFGDGLVEMVSDAFLQDNLASTATQRAALGIGGVFNTNGNDGTITRFGWKAQNKSLLMFAGEAYNVEMGVTNNLFQSDRFPAGASEATVAACTFNTSPEDVLNTINPVANIPANPLTFTTVTVEGVSLQEPVLTANPNSGTMVGTPSEMSSDIVNFAGFSQLLAPPTPTTSTPSELAGKSLFTQIGCALCHSPALVTDISNAGTQASGSPQNTLFQGLAGVTFHPFSDFAIHHMGSTLADGVTQGNALPDMFRTAPLWGVGQRLFFLHDGRTSDLLAAIEDHASNDGCVTTEFEQQFTIDSGAVGIYPNVTTSFCGSEANAVVAAFNALPTTQQQEILDFLRSL